MEEIYESVVRLFNYDPVVARFDRIVGDTHHEEAREARLMETTTPTAEVELPVVRPLTALDRCDRCGAQAYVVCEHAALGEMLFCAHHGREHKEKLVGGGWLVTETTVPA